MSYAVAAFVLAKGVSRGEEGVAGLPDEAYPSKGRKGGANVRF